MIYIIIEILLFAISGCLLGVLTGIIPGLHVNTVSILLLSFAIAVNPYLIAVAVISLAISHTFFDFIASLFLGVPEESTALSVLPGHSMLLEGKAIEALYLTIVGGLLSVLVAFFLLPFFIITIPFLYSSIQSYIHWILLGIAFTMVASEKGKMKIYSLIVFIMSGILGIISLNAYMLPFYMTLFPIFTGLFGMSNLIISINRKVKIPEQDFNISPIPKGISISGILKGLFSGVILGVLPGVGSSEAAILTQQITRRANHREFLVSIGAINTIVALFSLISLFTILKPRSGAAIVVQRLIPSFGFNELLLLIGVALFSAGLASILLMKSMRRIAALLQKINYTKLTTSVIALLIILVVAMTGLYGLLLLFVSTSIGLLAPLFGVRRSSAMGVLMVPLILFYTFGV